MSIVGLNQVAVTLNCVYLKDRNIYHQDVKEAVSANNFQAGK